MAESGMTVEAAPGSMHMPREAEESVDRIVTGRLLNIFLRELGGGCDSAERFEEAQLSEIRSHGRPLCIELPATRRALLVGLSRSSLSGHHDFTGPIWVRAGACAAARVATPSELGELLLAELAAREDPAEAERRRLELLVDLETSLANVRHFAAFWQKRALTHDADTDSFLQAEQGLIFGHPFHPAPKGCDPAHAAALSQYRPELGKSFQLHYLALAPELLLEHRLEGVADTIALDVRQAAEHRLPYSTRSWPLLPVHPLQEKIVAARSEVAALIRAGGIIELGALGERVAATSSVRTVYAPKQDLFFKLALDTRITNFVRTNPLEHLERSLAASRILSQIQKQGTAPYPVIVPELAYRGIAPQAWPSERLAQNVSSFAVLFRQGLRAQPCQVVAALLEPAYEGRAAPISQILWGAAQARDTPVTAVYACQWLRCYCEAAIIPVLSLFFRFGISLEAHVQNSLVAFAQGWPSRLSIRDLEGTSISRSRAREQHWFDDMLSENSPVLTSEEEAWQRLLYYLIVNHGAHLIATVARYSPAQEWQLWQTFRCALEDATELWSGAGEHYLRDLFSRPELPAKANLLSRFAKRSEKPVYVAIRNPLTAEAVAS